jgi:hypothetical protein
VTLSNHSDPQTIDDRETTEGVGLFVFIVGIFTAFVSALGCFGI